MNCNNLPSPILLLRVRLRRLRRWHVIIYFPAYPIPVVFQRHCYPTAVMTLSDITMTRSTLEWPAADLPVRRDQWRRPAGCRGPCSAHRPPASAPRGPSSGAGTRRKAPPAPQKRAALSSAYLLRVVSAQSHTWGNQIKLERTCRPLALMSWHEVNSRQRAEIANKFISFELAQTLFSLRLTTLGPCFSAIRHITTGLFFVNITEGWLNIQTTTIR